jgi:hypothetical protein
MRPYVEENAMRSTRVQWWLGVTLLAAAVLLAAAWTPGAWAAATRTFETPEQAVESLIAAVRKGDNKAILAILGPQAKSLVSSGDPVADRALGERFVRAYDASHSLKAGGGKIVLITGEDDFPFAIPVVPDGPRWRFDTAAGKEEIENRRIGRNELDAVQVCLAYVDAQREYYTQARMGDGVQQYARRTASTPGKRDGLYWDVKPGERPSPLGPLVASARAEGYGPRAKGQPAPYHGYYYRVLEGQGPQAPGGAYAYVANGRMIGGFALIAFPAQYGVSGVTTFMVNHDGMVYQKDLGRRTATLARQINTFDPDPTWQKVATE